MNMKLYDISDRYLSALQYFEGQDDPTLAADTLESIEGELEEKAISIAGFTGNLAAEAEAIDNAIKHMQARKKALESKTEWLKNYLKINMEATGITEIKCPYFVIKVKKNPPSVLIEDESLIPEKFRTVEMVEKVTIDKTAIKNAGGCDGVKITQGTRIEIK